MVVAHRMVDPGRIQSQQHEEDGQIRSRCCEAWVLRLAEQLPLGLERRACDCSTYGRWLAADAVGHFCPDRVWITCHLAG